MHACCPESKSTSHCCSVGAVFSVEALYVGLLLKGVVCMHSCRLFDILCRSGHETHASAECNHVLSVKRNCSVSNAYITFCAQLCVTRKVTVHAG